MPQPESQLKGRSEGVQIRLDPALKHEARVYLAMANMTWQDLLVPYVRQFVDEARRRTAPPARHTPQTLTPPDTPPLSLPPSPALALDLAALLGDTNSFELPLGNPTYRRWIHHCNCQRRLETVCRRPG
jgi:hypothetical protein